MNLYDALTIQDALSLIAGNLLAMKENERFVERLFREQEGDWIVVEPLCEGLPEVSDELQELGDSVRESLLVNWITFAGSYSIIVFLSTDVLWSTVALYNMKSFLEGDT